MYRASVVIPFAIQFGSSYHNLNVIFCMTILLTLVSYNMPIGCAPLKIYNIWLQKDINMQICESLEGLVTPRKETGFSAMTQCAKLCCYKFRVVRVN